MTRAPDHVMPCLCATALLFLLVTQHFCCSEAIGVVFAAPQQRIFAQRLLTVAKDIHPFRVKNMYHGVQANCQG